MDTKCLCGHIQVQHVLFENRCDVSSCTCQQYINVDAAEDHDCRTPEGQACQGCMQIAELTGADLAADEAMSEYRSK